MFLVGYIGAPPTMGSPAAKVPCVTVIAGAPIRAAATVVLRKMLRIMSVSFDWIDPESAEIIEGTDAGVNEFQHADHGSVNACLVQLEPLKISGRWHQRAFTLLQFKLRRRIARHAAIKKRLAILVQSARVLPAQHGDTVTPRLVLHRDAQVRPIVGPLAGKNLPADILL